MEWLDPNSIKRALARDAQRLAHLTQRQIRRLWEAEPKGEISRRAVEEAFQIRGIAVRLDKLRDEYLALPEETVDELVDICATLSAIAEGLGWSEEFDPDIIVPGERVVAPMSLRRAARYLQEVAGRLEKLRESPRVTKALDRQFGSAAERLRRIGERLS